MEDVPWGAPVLIAIILIIVVAIVIAIDYKTSFQGLVEKAEARVLLYNLQQALAEDAAKPGDEGFLTRTLETVVMMMMMMMMMMTAICF